ncbi:high-affinity branched-chain amino acid transporter permease LivH [Klebsiella grimontii]|uniref:High-affinity branched-chain amino acid transporter permease LivH n=1 Tax=Klebsiella grimontii TaxID=2058152 RepID=A0A7H4P8G7_9ENTR|nr:high-affinity branched-chain amino acid transporter permease LivH [Klebsiella grimontii]
MLGSIYALIALGYTMVYGILRIINFAHGDILMVGALTTLSGMHALNAHFPTLPPLAQLGLALLLAMTVCALLAMAVERFAYRRLRNAPRLAPLISGIGVSVLAANRGDDRLVAQSADVPADPANGSDRRDPRQRSASSGSHYRHRYRHRRAGPHGDAWACGCWWNTPA